MTNTLKRLIINADDFGLTKGVNRAIIEAFKFGTLTSTTIMANMPAFDNACTLAKENKGLGIGLHLNILRGTPVLPAKSIPTLAGKNGYFSGNIKFLLQRLFFKKIRIAEVESELRAQIEKTLSAGVPVTHLDSEKHLHCFPGLLNLTIKLARDYRILKVRLINEVGLLSQRKTFLFDAFVNLANKQYYKAIVLTMLCSLAKKKAELNRIIFPQNTWGISYAGKITERSLISALSQLNNGTTEFICHPGYIDSELAVLSAQMGGFFINKYREEELRALTAPKLPIRLKNLGIKLISYREL